MRPLDDLFEALARSRFRARFRLGAAEAAYLADKGLPLVLAHAAALVSRRLAPAHPDKDGRQTPMRGHPVFVAQHATATCCRACLARWHGVGAGRALGEAEKAHILAVLARWLEAQPVPSVPSVPPPPPRQPLLL